MPRGLWADQPGPGWVDEPGRAYECAAAPEDPPAAKLKRSSTAKPRPQGKVAKRCASKVAKDTTAAQPKSKAAKRGASQAAKHKAEPQPKPKVAKQCASQAPKDTAEAQPKTKAAKRCASQAAKDKAEAQSKPKAAEQPTRLAGAKLRELDTIPCGKCGEVCDPHGTHGAMVLCDALVDGATCNAGWHLGCLSPPLTVVPTGKWYCHEHRPVPLGHCLNCACPECTVADGPRKRTKAPVFQAGWG